MLPGCPQQRLDHPSCTGGICPFKGWLSRETTPPTPDSQSAVTGTCDVTAAAIKGKGALLHGSWTLWLVMIYVYGHIP